MVHFSVTEFYKNVFYWCSWHCRRRIPPSRFSPTNAWVAVSAFLALKPDFSGLIFIYVQIWSPRIFFFFFKSCLYLWKKLWIMNFSIPIFSDQRLSRGVNKNLVFWTKNGFFCQKMATTTPVRFMGHVQWPAFFTQDTVINKDLLCLNQFPNFFNSRKKFGLSEKSRVDFSEN